MDFSDLPRRQHTTSYPAPAQYENGYAPYGDIKGAVGNGNGYRGFDGTGGRPPQPVPWDAGPAAAGSGNTDSFPAFGDPAFDDPAFDDPAFDDPDDVWQGARHARRGRRERRERGLLAGSVAGFLAAAVALGVANLAAAFVRPQASPIIAVGGAFIDRTPPALKNFAVEKFGENDKTMLLLGMYVTIALIAIGVGMLAWRRIAIGVAGIGLFGLFGALTALTRPDSRVTDVIPAIAGGIAGIIAIIWLVRAGTRRAGHRPSGYDSGWIA